MQLVFSDPRFLNSVGSKILLLRCLQTNGLLVAVLQIQNCSNDIKKPANNTRNVFLILTYFVYFKI